MDLSKIKKIVLEEGKVVIIDGEDALVVMNFDEYKKSKSLPKISAVLPNVEAPEAKVVEADIAQISQQEVKSELTLDDLPF